MSIFHDYLMRQNFGPLQWEAERKAQLLAIQTLRKRPAITYAARISPPPGIAIPIDLNFSDLLAFYDLLSHIPKGPAIDVIVETPGGDGVVARDMVEMLHERFDHVAFIVPGWAKSAGTIMAMGAHEILMGPTSALGPIDAQLAFEGKRFSADALLEGMKEIQSEVARVGRLNPAFIPMLQRVSPGDLQNARNAMDFARVTVTEWLCKYKFSDWTTHRTHNPGTPVTPAEREKRAAEIAAELSAHSKWKTHARSLRLPDLRAMRLEIVDYSADATLFDAIQRYYTMVRFCLDAADIYKIIETFDAHVTQRFAVQVPQTPAAPSTVLANITCDQCKTATKVQMNFVPQPLAPGAVSYPKDERIVCGCGNIIDLKPIRRQAEQQAGAQIIIT